MVFAGAGNDIVSVGGGSDIVSLGAGDDVAHFVMPPLDNGSSQVQTVIWGGDGADSFYFADNTYVLSVSVDGITEDLLKNLSTSALFSLFNYDNEWSYDYIIINLEQQDKIFVEGTEITNAVVVQDIENEDTGFVFDYTFDHHGNDGWDWHYSESMTRTETRSQMDYFDTPGFDQTALSGGANGLVAIFGHFVLEGFVDGAAGIHFVGDGITGRLEVTTTVQQINVTSSDTTRYDPSKNAAYIVPKTYDLVGDPTSEHEVRWEGFHLRPDGYENNTVPTVDLTNLQRDADNVLAGNADEQDFHGWGGRDTVDYSASSEGVSLDLDYGGDGGDASGDTFDSVENVIGTAFDDTLWGSATGNVFTGNAGDDSLYGWLGDDTLLGGAGNDHLENGIGNDIVLGGEGNDFVVADVGNDSIDGGDGSDTVALSGGNIAEYTIFRTADDAVTIVGALDGIDMLLDVEIIALGGQNYNVSDLAPLLQTAALIEGTAADDSLNGTASNDIINGLEGDDTITADNGSDIVNAGAGDDVINGGAGNDVINAGDGDDTVIFTGVFSDFTLAAVDTHTVLVQADGINSIIRDAEMITFGAPEGGSDHSVDIAASLMHMWRASSLAQMAPTQFKVRPDAMLYMGMAAAIRSLPKAVTMSKQGPAMM
ncbi:serralysin-like metalloprotease domain-containing protein (plasmid) [Rhizobium phaseoli]|nr:serralysin-like metalloprotease domain-containing protein [Rhizobium phaseoli]ANL56586.1 serralysin-like metalloprotease domain-containing protein [Rhizobium phaseoli]ANL63535.1 serralysin-like metalloprotease domain-containing protein [Rhizobium phaseoli]